MRHTVYWSLVIYAGWFSFDPTVIVAVWCESFCATLTMSVGSGVLSVWHFEIITTSDLKVGGKHDAKDCMCVST
jgi:hypothetical protein